MQCRKNFILNTGCGYISASQGFHPTGEIKHLVGKKPKQIEKKQRPERKKRHPLILLFFHLIRGEGVPPHCHGAWHVAAESKYLNQEVRFPSEFIEFFKFDQRRRVCVSKWSKRPITGARTLGSILNWMSRRDKCALIWQLTNQLDQSVNSQENTTGSYPKMSSIAVTLDTIADVYLSLITN